MNDSTQTSDQAIHFKAETRQILDILIHSLYTEREIFLRELISNASDALTRMDFEMLTNREVLDPDAELAIWIETDSEAKTLTIKDTGIGMTADELVENLGTIAHSGARAFLDAAKSGSLPEGKNISDVIGQFGVGFYSVFMVAEWVRVTSRSYQPDAQAAAWYCTGSDTFTVEPAEKAERGTIIEVKLKEDAEEFSQDYRINEVIRKHSDFIPFPIYTGKDKEQANRRTALWRQQPRQVEKKDYEEFYKQITLDFEPPLTYAHMVVDAPVQMYALLFVPTKADRGMFSIRKEEGLKLYSRKVLIQEYCKDLLPDYLGFIQGVVDSEDLPLNVSRESVQSNRIMVNLKKLVTGKVMDMLKKLSEDEAEQYTIFWKEMGRYIKQGVAIEQTEPETLYPLLRFHTTTHTDTWTSLDEYVARMQDGQEEIYYILGDDEHSVLYSPHLDLVKERGYEVLLLTDPIDSFMLVRLTQYKDHHLKNVAAADLKLPESEKTEDEPKVEGAPNPEVPAEDWIDLIDRFKAQLGDRVSDVRMTDRLSDSPARLVDPDGSPAQEFQRVYRYLREDFEAPKKVLELNPRHPILVGLNQETSDSELSKLAIEQIFENALLIEGLHKDPASMISRIHKIMEAALRK
jgi:molecular chaperone HtpG